MGLPWTRLSGATMPLASVQQLEEADLWRWDDLETPPHLPTDNGPLTTMSGVRPDQSCLHEPQSRLSP